MAAPDAPESVFVRIIRGEIPCHKVYEDEHVFAFLDVNPLSPGHTLVIPKNPVERLEDLPAEQAARIGGLLGQIARRVLNATGAADYNILQNNGETAGQVVPHVHFHIIPRKSGDGLGYRWNAAPADQHELAELARRINAVRGA